MSELPHTCVNTCTTIDMTPPPPCQTCMSQLDVHWSTMTGTFRTVFGPKIDLGFPKPSRDIQVK